jgi:SAM-dependent methyltransferase
VNGAEAAREQPAPPIGATAWERVSALSEFGRYRSVVQREALRRATALTGGGTALDIGCAEGRWSMELRDLGWELICADTNQGSLETCRARLPDARCVLTLPTSATLPAGDGSLRLLLAYEVPPVTQASWFADEASRVLEPGGALVCTFQNRLSWRGVAVRAHCLVSARRRARGGGGGDSYEGPTYHGFQKTLLSRGFRIVHEEGIAWIPLSSSSDSRLVWTFSELERSLGLRRRVALSPTIVVVAVRCR